MYVNFYKNVLKYYKEKKVIQMSKIALIDGNSLMFRSYYATAFDED